MDKGGIGERTENWTLVPERTIDASYHNAANELIERIIIIPEHVGFTSEGYTAVYKQTVLCSENGSFSVLGLGGTSADNAGEAVYNRAEAAICVSHIPNTCCKLYYFGAVNADGSAVTAEIGTD